MWLSHQRIHQFRGGHDEAWGGVTMDIDSDQVDAVLDGAGGPPAVRTAFRPAVDLDGGTAPDWFARAADRTLVHDVQQPSGSWSGITPVGSSPANIASNPAVVANASAWHWWLAVTPFWRSEASVARLLVFLARRPRVGVQSGYPVGFLQG